MLECAQALDNAGAAQIVVHARTKAEAYKPPAHWHCIAQIREVVKQAHVIANGEIWTVEDYWQCRRESGCDDVMLEPIPATGRLKSWLAHLRHTYPEAEADRFVAGALNVVFYNLNGYFW